MVAYILPREPSVAQYEIRDIEETRLPNPAANIATPAVLSIASIYSLRLIALTYRKKASSTRDTDAQGAYE